MTSSRTAQGLASLGRNGDTMLMHVSPSEVGGLKKVGDSLGIKMTTNPYTGMPEAFNFGDFFTSFLPTIAGIAAAPATGGFSMAPILAGAGTGAALAAAKGQDPLMGGLTGGLGGYGGGQLAPTFGSMSTAGSNAITNKVATDAAYKGSLGAMQGAAGGATQAGATSFGAGLTPEVSTAIANPMGVNAATPSFGSQMLSQAQTNLGNTVSAGKDFLSSPSTAYKAFTDAGGTAMDLAMPVGGAVLSGLEPSDLGYGTGNLYNDPDKDKYRGPQGQLNLSDRFDTGLRLVAKGGYIDGYAMGGTVQSSGIRDLYGTPDNPPTMSSGLGGFGLGRLNNLANEQAMSQAQTLGYDEGGSVEGSTKGITTAEGIASIDPSRVRGDMVDDMAGLPYRYDRIVTPGALDFYTIPSLEYNPETYARALRKQEGMAEGGDVSNYGKDQVSLNLDRLPSLNLGGGKYDISGRPEGLQKLITGFGMAGESPNVNPGFRVFSKMMSGAFGGDPEMIGAFQGKGVPSSVLEGIDFKDYYDRNPSQYLPGYVPTAPAVSINPSSGNTSAQNSAFVNRRAKGGYLDGAGDGMSDSIPATIEGKQPARLADGEFVIPADVVSHLGNGSSKAGSKRLYAMLDKIRHARTGTKKQGKQINPSKYMPA